MPPLANEVALTPLSFLERAADVFGDKPAVVGEDGEATAYAPFRERCAAMAGALRAQGVAPGERVAILARNTPDMLAAHYGVPGARAVLVPLNIRLAPAEYAYILDHSGARALFVDPALADRVAPALADVPVPVVDLPAQPGEEPAPHLGVAFEEWLAAGDAAAGLQPPADEHDPIALNYTSGTTGSPKGAVYTHRGAYLNALGLCVNLGLTVSSVYLWTLPMFHCDGWCCTWAVTAPGATHVCLASFDPVEALRRMAAHDVTHFCGAPIVLNELARVDPDQQPDLTRSVRGATGGAPPAPTTIQAMHDLGIDVIHLYGLTETYGPSMICEVQPGWRDADPGHYADLVARQGVRTINVETVDVLDADQRPVPSDGETMGEIVVRSNTVMRGYHEDEAATARAFEGGWFHTGDLAVVHPDGYVEVRDRSKDIIISGGENISSIEIEKALLSHPDVIDAAVVAAPDERWGEVPVAFVTVREGAEPPTDVDLIVHVQDRLARFKAPKAIVRTALPKTSTGKTQKYTLREQARQLREADRT